MVFRHAADGIVRGGRIITLDPANPSAEALAFSDGRIVAVGSTDEIDRLRGKDTRIVDAAGRVVTPGLIDGHAHVALLGNSYDELDVGAAASEDEAVQALLKGQTGSDWLIGRNFDQTRWSSKALPSKRSLDRAFPDRPVLIKRVDHHCCWLNSRALEALGSTFLDRAPSEQVARAEDGSPSGLLFERAMELALACLPTRDFDTRVRRLEQAAYALRQLGIGSVHDMATRTHELEALRFLAERDRLAVRVRCYLCADEPEEYLSWIAQGLARGEGDSVRVVGLKLFLDGALGSRGARLTEPYADDPKHSGMASMAFDDVQRIVRAAFAADIPVALHAIGDAAVHEAVEHVRRGLALGGLPTVPARIEHAQLVAPEDVRQIAKLGLSVGTQFLHWATDAPWAMQRLGSERLALAYPWRRLIDGGVRLVGGSDVPVADADPRLGFCAARQREPGALSPTEILAAYTSAAADAVGEGHQAGRLRAGAVADVTFWSVDPLESSIAALREASLETLVAGR